MPIFHPLAAHALLTRPSQFHFAVDQWDYDRYRVQVEARLKALRARKAAYVSAFPL